MDLIEWLRTAQIEDQSFIKCLIAANEIERLRERNKKIQKINAENKRLRTEIEELKDKLDECKGWLTG